MKYVNTNGFHAYATDAFSASKVRDELNRLEKRLHEKRIARRRKR